MKDAVDLLNLILTARKIHFTKGLTTGYTTDEYAKAQAELIAYHYNLPIWQVEELTRIINHA